MVAKRLLPVCAGLLCLGPAAPSRAAAADQFRDSVITQNPVAPYQFGLQPPGFMSQAYRDSIYWLLQRLRGVHDSTAMARLPKERIVFDSDQVAEIVKGFNPRPYRVDQLTKTGEYEVHVSTPVSEAWKAHKNSRKRSKEPSVPAEGVERLPLVTIQFIPKTRSIQEMKYYGTFTVSGDKHTEYKANFEGARLFRDSLEIEAFSVSNAGVAVDGGWIMGQQSANSGVVQLEFDAFHGSGDGSPRIRIELAGGHKGFFSTQFKQAKPTVFYLPELTLRRIVADIEMCRRASRSPEASAH